MTHKTIINICLTLIALCWTVAIQAQTVTIDGINYSLNADAKTAEVTKSTATGDIVIPEKITVDGVEYSVTSIGIAAFKDSKALTSVAMPSVTSIGISAFFECKALTSVNMPSVTSIGSSAFSACSSLTSVTMPSVTSIGINAFNECKALTSVAMPSVTSIGDQAFWSCSSLTSVAMPSVTSIGISAFSACSSLTSVVMPLVTSIDDYAFLACSSLTSMEMPSVTSIGINAFYNCKALTSVAMPSVTSIGEGAFNSCSSLESVAMPSVTSIGDGAFNSCSSLESVTMPSVTSIGDRAFNSCSSLESVDMPSVTSIGGSAFNSCSNLESVNLLKVVSIKDYAFYGTLIINVSLPATLQSLGSGNFNNAAKVVLASTTPPVITDGCGKDVFSSFTAFLVPETSLEVYRNADVWKNYAKQMLSLSDRVDYDVTTTAQDNTSCLRNVIGEDNFAKVVSLKVTGTINSYDIMVIRNKMPLLHFLDLTDATIVANDYEYYTGCHTEDNVIGKSMFCELNKLVSVKLPKNVTSIRNNALSSCTRLVEVVLPVKLESIGASAFNNCINLTNIDFPPTLKTIGGSAFSYCYNLTNINLPPTLKTIGGSAFVGCSRLKKISLPGVESIGDYAFRGCDFTEVRIPSTLKSIGDGAFDCRILKKVYTYTVEPINIGQNTFYKPVYETGILYIPRQSSNNYYWNTQWSQFSKLEEFDEPYKYFYLNKEFTLEDRFTGEPDIDINPGGGIIVPGKPEQGADTIHIKGDGKNWASIIANANLNAKGLYIDITIKANRWYFFSFPFKVRKADISCGKNVKFVFRTYNGAIRAEYGKGGWIDLKESEEYLYPGKGYIFQASLDCTLSIKIEKNAFGKLPKLDVNTQLNVHTSTNEQNASWNFVGNPFTAFYDINDMGYTSPITRWNSNSKTYEAVRPGDDNAFLNPFEAFFVQCPKDNDDINFGGDNRLTQTGRDKKMNCQMQKARMEGQFDVQRQIVNLTLSDGTTTDKTRVVFNPDKKAGYERDCDAAKFESNGASELYSVEALAGRLAINERPEGSVKIGYRAAKAGEYTIAAQRMDRQVLLRDNDLQITFDLTQGDYHFTSDAGEFDNRFMLLIDNSTTGIGDIVTTTGVNVKPTDSGLNISNLQGKTLHVYALNGALYATRTQDGFLGLAKGVYLVEVEGLKAKFMVR